MQTHFKFRLTLLLFFISICFSTHAQALINKTSAPNPLEWMLNMNAGIKAAHFPETIDAIRIITKKDTIFYWKHNTSVMNITPSPIAVEEAGAYIYVNHEWTLRVKYNQKDFSKLINCPKGILDPLQPYTFNENWRTGKQLYAGFALWYVKGKDENGKDFIGYKTLYTSDSIHTTLQK